MKRKQTATIDELEAAFAEDKLPFDMDAHRRKKDEIQRSKIKAAIEARNAAQAMRDLSGRCRFCGLAIEGPRVSETFVEPGRRYVGNGKGVGQWTVSTCKACLRRFQAVLNWRGQEQGSITYFATPTAETIRRRLEEVGMMDYWPKKGQGRNPDSALIPLSWAAWAFRSRRAGHPDPGDATVAFSHLLDVRPSDLDWRPPLPG